MTSRRKSVVTHFDVAPPRATKPKCVTTRKSACLTTRACILNNGGLSVEAISRQRLAVGNKAVGSWLRAESWELTAKSQELTTKGPTDAMEPSFHSYVT